MTPPYSNHFDVIIAGGGLVGATLACALGNSPLKVAIIEGQPRQKPDDLIPELRVSAITRASQRILDNLDVWRRVPTNKKGEFREMRVWDATGSGQIHFDAATLAEPQLGWIVGNRSLQWPLLEKAEDHGNVTLFCPNRLQSIQHKPDVLQLQLDNDQRLSTRLLVGADGGRSRVRHWADIPVQNRNYRQKALVTTVATEKPHDRTARQRFMPTGPLAFLPLASGHCSIVWSTSPEQADELMSLSDDSFNTRLTDAFDARLGKVAVVGERGVFPLQSQHAQHYVQPRIALIGDAAHVIHPLAGQGANLGFLDAATLAEVLLDDPHRDPGSMAVLRRYERWRRGENLLMIKTMDGFKELFGNELPPLRWLRNHGLNLTDALSPIKQLIISRAMGLAGDLPKLARNPTTARA